MADKSLMTFNKMHNSQCSGGWGKDTNFFGNYFKVKIDLYILDSAGKVIELYKKTMADNQKGNHEVLCTENKGKDLKVGIKIVKTAN